MVYYLPDTEPAPTAWADFWDWADIAFGFVETDFKTLRFETEDDALQGRYRKSLDANDFRLDSWDVIRFRETDDRDNLLYFFELGRSVLEDVGLAIGRREWTPQAAQQWAILHFSHGFVMASTFARGDDLQSRRAGQASRNVNSRHRHDQWFAHYFLREFRRVHIREAAVDAVERLIRAIIAGEMDHMAKLDRKWFGQMLHEGSLTGRYSRDLSVKAMQRLEAEPTDGLPALDLKIPHP